MNTEAMRAAFEADAESMGFDLTRQSIAVPEPWAEYLDGDTGHRWAGWIAATERAALVCEGEYVGDSIDDADHPDQDDRAYNSALRNAAAAIRSGK